MSSIVCHCNVQASIMYCLRPPQYLPAEVSTWRRPHWGCPWWLPGHLHLHLSDGWYINNIRLQLWFHPHQEKKVNSTSKTKQTTRACMIERGLQETSGILSWASWLTSCSNMHRIYPPGTQPPPLVLPCTVEMSIMHRLVNTQNLCIIRFMHYQIQRIFQEINVSKLTRIWLHMKEII